MVENIQLSTHLTKQNFCYSKSFSKHEAIFSFSKCIFSLIFLYVLIQNISLFQDLTQSYSRKHYQYLELILYTCL